MVPKMKKSWLHSTKGMTLSKPMLNERNQTQKNKLDDSICIKFKDRQINASV